VLLSGASLAWCVSAGGSRDGGGRGGGRGGKGGNDGPVKYQGLSHGGGGGGGGVTKGRRITVSGLPRGQMNPAGVSDLFSSCGRVESSSLVGKSGRLQVVMDSAASANKAVSTYNNTDMNGRQLSVTIA
jgi:hypothetical protein